MWHTALRGWIPAEDCGHTSLLALVCICPRGPKTLESLEISFVPSEDLHSHKLMSRACRSLLIGTHAHTPALPVNCTQVGSCRYTWLNYTRYGWGALMVNQFDGKNLQLVPGVEILSYYSLDHLSKWAWLGYQTIFFGGLFFLTWLALACCKHAKR